MSGNLIICHDFYAGILHVEQKRKYWEPVPAKYLSVPGVSM